MYLPKIREGGNYRIVKAIYYPKRKSEYGRKTIIPGYFELTVRCREHREEDHQTTVITIFDSELEKITGMKTVKDLI